MGGKAGGFIHHDNVFIVIEDCHRLHDDRFNRRSTLGLKSNLKNCATGCSIAFNPRLTLHDGASRIDHILGESAGEAKKSRQHDVKSFP
jgi:hypothetical protein